VSAVLDGVADKDKESYLKFDDGTDFEKNPRSGIQFPFRSYSQHQAPAGDLSCLPYRGFTILGLV